MLILIVSPMLALMAGQGHWPLMPTKARVYPSGAALTHPTFQLKVLITAFGFEVAVALALVVAVDLIVEQAENTDVLDVVDVTSVVELSAVELGEEKVTVKLVDNWLLELELVTMLEVVGDNWLLELELVTMLEVVGGNWLLELELVTMLEVVEDKTLDEELGETGKGPVF